MAFRFFTNYYFLKSITGAVDLGRFYFAYTAVIRFYTSLYVKYTLVSTRLGGKRERRMNNRTAS